MLSLEASSAPTTTPHISPDVSPGLPTFTWRPSAAFSTMTYSTPSSPDALRYSTSPPSGQSRVLQAHPLYPKDQTYLR